MQNSLNAVIDFHKAMGAPVAVRPTLLSGNRRHAAEVAAQLSELANRTASAAVNDVLMRRCAIALEELSEWMMAHAEADLVAAADAWADRTYVLLGDAVAAGLPAEALFNEVHRSNMTKDPDSATTGKAVKGSSYEPPELSEILKPAND